MSYHCFYKPLRAICHIQLFLFFIYSAIVGALGWPFGKFEEATSKATLIVLYFTAIGGCFNCQQHIQSPSLRKDKGDRKTVNNKLDAECLRWTETAEESDAKCGKLWQRMSEDISKKTHDKRRRAAEEGRCVRIKQKRFGGGVSTMKMSNLIMLNMKQKTVWKSI